MALPATDAFTGTNGTALQTYSGSWSIRTGGFVLNTNAVAPSSAGLENAAWWNADAFADDQYATGTIAAIGGSALGLAVRVDTGANNSYYGYYSDATTSYLFKSVAGTWTQLGSTGAAWAVNDVVRLEISGTSLRPMVNGSTASIGSQTTSDLASGSAGLSGWNSDTSNRLDNWEGGDLGGGAAADESIHNQEAPDFHAQVDAVQDYWEWFLSGPALVRQRWYPIPNNAGALEMALGAGISNARIALPDNDLFNEFWDEPGALAAFGWWMPEDAGGGTTFNQDTAGTVANTGALAMRTSKGLSGAVTSAGTLVKSTVKALAGTVSSAGSLSKRILKALAGAVANSGALATTRVVLKSVSGAVANTGALATRTGKSLAGAVSSAGSLSKRMLKALAGTVANSGALGTTRVVLKSVSGAVANTGALAMRTGKSLAGAMSSDGSLSKLVMVRLSGAVSSAASLVGEIVSVVTGWIIAGINAVGSGTTGAGASAESWGGSAGSSASNGTTGAGADDETWEVN